MKCPNCGYENSVEKTKNNRCDECGYLLSQKKSCPPPIYPQQIPSDVIVIATFNNSLEANLSQQVLEEQGIESWLQDEATVNIAWYLTTAVGWIKLNVREQDREIARTILDEYQASVIETSEDSDLTVEVEDESLSELTESEQILRRALRVALVGLILLPLQLYSLWLLLTLFRKGMPRTPRQKLTFVITLGLDLAVLIVLWSLILLL